MRGKLTLIFLSLTLALSLWEREYKIKNFCYSVLVPLQLNNIGRNLSVVNGTSAPHLDKKIVAGALGRDERKKSYGQA